LNKFILGSGVVGLLAKHILGDQYTLIPYKKSRYYSFDIPIADNEIAFNDQTSELLSSLHILTKKQYFPTAVSLKGELFFNKNIWINPVVEKIYQDDPHPLAAKILSADIDAHSVTVKELYGHLMEKHSKDINAGLQMNIDSISTSKRTITIDGETFDYDRIVSTIPLYTLLNLTKTRSPLDADDYHVYLIATDAFNLEGAKRCFIGDLPIPFWKVNVIGQGAYQFFSNGEAAGAEAVFSLLTKGRFRIVASTKIDRAFPRGAPPVILLERLKSNDIECIGSNARWDYFYDISTCLNHLLKMKNV